MTCWPLHFSVGEYPTFILLMFHVGTIVNLSITDVMRLRLSAKDEHSGDDIQYNSMTSSVILLLYNSSTNSI